MVVLSMPVRRAQSARMYVSLLNVSIRLLRVFLLCSARVSQIQFSGLYGPLLFFRSMVEVLLGLAPISW